MKPTPLRVLAKGLKFFLLTGLVLFSITFFMAMKARKAVDDIWKQLGIALPQANMNIRNSFVYGNFYYGGAKLAKDVALGDRVAVVKQLVAHAKKYYSSAEFKTEYASYRKRLVPKEPIKPTLTAESVKADEKARLEKNLKTAEEGLNSPNPKIKNSAPSRIEKIKKDLEALEDPDNPVIRKKLADADRSYEAGLKRYNDQLVELETKYPENPDVLLKQRLQQIIDITADVDYNAELKEAFKKKVFVNPVYEKKSAGWKMAFRAGKETTDAVRAAAQQWLNELK